MPTTVVDTTLALISLDDAKEFLKITGTSSEDSILSAIINEVSQAVNSFCGRTLLSKAYVEYYDGSGKPELILRNFPIVTLTSLYDDTERVFSDPIDKVNDVIVMKEKGILRLWNNESAFSCGVANVKVSYTAGYALASIPQDIQLAVRRWVAVQYFKYSKKRHEVQSETVGDTTTTYVDQEVPKDVQAILTRYKTYIEAPDFSHAD